MEQLPGISRHDCVVKLLRFSKKNSPMALSRVILLMALNGLRLMLEVISISPFLAMFHPCKPFRSSKKNMSISAV